MKKLSPFAIAARRSYASSKNGTKTAERMTFSQSTALKPFTLAERTGQPLKSSEWRS